MTAQHERSLQSEILYRLNRYPVVAIPVPNGIWVPARGEAEEDIVQDLKHAHLSGDPPEAPGAAPLVRGHCGEMPYCGLDSAPIAAPPTHWTNRLRRVPRLLQGARSPGAIRRV